MDIKQRYVYMVYREKSFTRAAEKLYISQPSLSAMIKKAELELGAPIFDRNAVPLGLTEAGEAYIDFLENIARCEETLNEKLWSLQNLVKGTVRLGGSNYVLSNIVPRILPEILSGYPGVHLDIIEENSFNLRRMLQEQAIDLVIDSFTMDDDTLVYHHLLNEQIMLAVPKKLCKKDLPPEDEVRSLLELPFILLKPENDMYERAQRYFAYYQASPGVLFELDQLMTALQYAESGLGCTFVTDTLFKYGKKAEHIQLLPIDSGIVPFRNLCIAHKKGKYVSSPCRLLIEEAVKVFS